MNIYIIGGGPVGLYCSIMLKKYLKGSNVVVYEKRTEYSRHQILYIDKKIATHFPRKLYYALWGSDHAPGCYIGQSSRTQDASCNVRKSGLSVVINILEQHLKKLALELGVKIITREISAQDVEIISKTADYIIGADGTHSILDTFLNAKMIIGKESMGMGIVFNYQDDAVPRDYMKYPQHRFRAFKSNTHPHVGYIGINIDKTETDNELEKTINTAFKFYGFKNTENVKTWKFKITPYKKSVVIGKLNNAKLILIGDSAIGVHFFSGAGVNNGFDSVHVLCKLLRDHESLVEYKKHITWLGKINIKNNNNLVLDFDKIAKKCNALTDAQLYNIAHAQKIYDPEIIPRKELCLMISFSKQ